MSADVKMDRGPEEYAAPTTIEEAARLVFDGEARVLAGGTDLMIQTRDGGMAYRKRLVNIRRISEMRGISKDGQTVRIGALSTLTDILNNEFLVEMAPVLRQTADQFASGQIRNAATLGGNICNASPAGDSIPALLVLDASVELAFWDGGAVATRTVALNEFFSGPGQTLKGDNELLTAVTFPLPEQRAKAQFIKSGPRPALEISIVSMAFSAVREDDTLFHVRIALGSVAPTPLRAVATEAFLEGKTLSADIIEAAKDVLMGEINPIDDVRATAWYRRHLACVYLGRLLGDDD